MDIIIIIFFSLLISSLLTSVTQAAKRARKNDYLYQGTSAHPITEYLLDKAEVARNDGHENPTFTLDVTWPRIVQFYLPDSRVCLDFKPHFISTARELRRRSSRSSIEFHAVSCTIHAQLCTDFAISGVPHVLAYPSGSSSGHVLKRTESNELSVAYVAETIGVALDDEVEDAAGEETELSPLFRDAASSFVYALLASVAPVEYLPEGHGDAFREWIDLLHWTLPSQWAIHNLINDVRQSYDLILEEPRKLEELVRGHGFANVAWSEDCSKGEKGVGYACGFWKLLHIMSVGVAEQRTGVIGDLNRISTAHVGKTTRDYIEYFFDCAICKLQFTSLYDGCAYDRCRRLVSGSSSGGDKSTWKELALWIWEMHNDVNVRLLKDDAQRRRMGVVGEANERAVKWPSVDACPDCWREDGGYDHDKVYDVLKREYWPRGIHNPRLVVLNEFKKGGEKPKFIENFEPTKIVAWWLFLIPTITIFVVRWNWIKARFEELKERWEEWASASDINTGDNGYLESIGYYTKTAKPTRTSSYNRDPLRGESGRSRRQRTANSRLMRNNIGF